MGERDGVVGLVLVLGLLWVGDWIDTWWVFGKRIDGCVFLRPSIRYLIKSNEQLYIICRILYNICLVECFYTLFAQPKIPMPLNNAHKVSV